MIIAGSYVPKTTAQLESLTSQSGSKLTTILLHVHELLASSDDATRVVQQAQEKAASEIAKGQDVLVMTSRELIIGKDGTESLNIGSIVAKALVAFLTGLQCRPRYVIAKVCTPVRFQRGVDNVRILTKRLQGGITSSDAATKGLVMKAATVVGQAAPGVPLWECLEETSKWSGIPYVVFPGNVGSVDTLFQVVDGWRS